MIAHVHIYKFSIYCLIADFQPYSRSHVMRCRFLCPGALEVVYASVVVMCKVLNGVNCSTFPCDHIHVH